MFPNTATIEQIFDEEWLENLRICICGNIIQAETHEGCLISGISRGIFTDISGWRGCSKENGQRIAQHYRETARFIASYKASSG